VAGCMRVQMSAASPNGLLQAAGLWDAAHAVFPLQEVSEAAICTPAQHQLQSSIDQACELITDGKQAVRRAVKQLLDPQTLRWPAKACRPYFGRTRPGTHR
jgi:hypothetical protein